MSRLSDVRVENHNDAAFSSWHFTQLPFSLSFSCLHPPVPPPRDSRYAEVCKWGNENRKRSQRHEYNWEGGGKVEIE